MEGFKLAMFQVIIKILVLNYYGVTFGDVFQPWIVCLWLEGQ